MLRNKLFRLVFNNRWSRYRN